MVEFLLGAVIGQSGSSGFRQGRSIYPWPTSALFSISSQVSTWEFIFFSSSKNSKGSKLVHCKWGFPLSHEEKNEKVIKSCQTFVNIYLPFPHSYSHSYFFEMKFTEMCIMVFKTLPQDLSFGKSC